MNLVPAPQLLNMLKVHTGHNPAVGTANDTVFYQILSDVQRWLASEWDWPFLRTRFDVTLKASTRFFSMPTALDTQRPIKVEVKYNQAWQEVDYGIGSDEYNDVDSDLGTTLDPVQRWQWGTQQSATSETSEQGQFEVWPIPASDGQILRFTGQRVPVSLVGSDGNPTTSAVADLDDELIVLFAAAELLARYDQKDAQIKLTRAQQRLLKLRAIYPSRKQDYILGSGQRDDTPKRVVPLVIVTTHN